MASSEDFELVGPGGDGDGVEAILQTAGGVGEIRQLAKLLPFPFKVWGSRAVWG